MTYSSYIPLTGQDNTTGVVIDSGGWLFDNLIATNRLQTTRLQRGDLQLVSAWSNALLFTLGSKLVRVYDAYDFASLTLSGRNVTTWSNLAPGATSTTNATQNTAANQPTYDALNRRINFGSGISTRFLNFNGFGSSNTFTGTVYIGTNLGVHVYNITVPGTAPTSFEWGRSEAGILVTGMVFVTGILSAAEERIVVQWLGLRQSSGLFNPSIRGSLSTTYKADSFTNIFDYITNIETTPIDIVASGVNTFFVGQSTGIAGWYRFSYDFTPSLNSVHAGFYDFSIVRFNSSNTVQGFARTTGVVDDSVVPSPLAQWAGSSNRITPVAGTTYTMTPQEYPTYTAPFSDGAAQQCTVTTFDVENKTVSLSRPVTLKPNVNYQLVINNEVRNITNTPGSGSPMSGQISYDG